MAKESQTQQQAESVPSLAELAEQFEALEESVPEPVAVYELQDEGEEPLPSDSAATATNTIPQYPVSSGKLTTEPENSARIFNSTDTQKCRLQNSIGTFRITTGIRLVILFIPSCLIIFLGLYFFPILSWMTVTCLALHIAALVFTTEKNISTSGKNIWVGTLANITSVIIYILFLVSIGRSLGSFGGLIIFSIFLDSIGTISSFSLLYSMYGCSKAQRIRRENRPITLPLPVVASSESEVAAKNTVEEPEDQFEAEEVKDTAATTESKTQEEPISDVQTQEEELTEESTSAE